MPGVSLTLKGDAMAGKPHVEKSDHPDGIPMTYRDYPGDVEPSESVEISVAHLDSLPTAAPVAAPDHAAKSAKKEN